jgi:hypothetical protein
MFRKHRERGSGGGRFSVAGASASETQDKKTLTLALSQGERGWSREEARKNVQIASGCIKNWYGLRVGVSRCYSEVLLRQRIAAMPLDETRTLKSCIKNGPFGGPRRFETAADSLAWRALGGGGSPLESRLQAEPVTG